LNHTKRELAAASWGMSLISNSKPNKKKVGELHEELIRETGALVIYTDRSGIDGKVEMAAMASHRMILADLGLITSYTVFSAEL